MLASTTAIDSSKHVDGNVGFVFGDDERRRDADRARTAAQKQNAALERQFDDAIALAGAILAGLLDL